MSEMKSDSFVVLVPTLQKARTGKMAPRLATLDDKTIGFLWNNRPHGDEIFNLIVDELKKKYRIKGTVVEEKPYLGNLAPQKSLDKLANTCDAVITGIGD